MQHTKLIKADAAINLILGILLMAFPAKLIKVLGIPMADLSFYPAILGGVLFGIGLALLVECYRRTNRFIGLGLAGAVLINLCGGFVLAFWLLWGQLNLPVRGLIFLWTLVVLLIGLSLLEGLAHLKKIE
jgi:riboflavin transporter FmnP